VAAAHKKVNIMRPWWIGLVAALLLASAPVSYAQQNRGTLNYSAKITTGNTYQTLRGQENRWSVTIQNNNASDGCYLFIGGTQITPATTTTSSTITVNGVSMTAAQASISLAAGASWARYYPYVPNDAIYGTCATTGDSLYVDIQ
jgi:hypothetical protein